MNREEENMDSLPIDLINEILSRLPAKSVARFRCVSKLWGSTIAGPYFKELFLTMSRTRPRILFTLLNSDFECSFFSLPQLQNPYQKSSLVVAADFRIKLDLWSCCGFPYGYASGLIYFSEVMISEKTVSIICNPSTGQYAILPKQNRLKKFYNFLGFDPIGKQYKVLSMDDPDSGDRNILTLGPGTMIWRNIQCPLPHYARGEGTCINGVLYYLGENIDWTNDIIVCFDVRSEKFKFVEGHHSFDENFTVVNYKGKLGVFDFKHDDASNVTKLCMWVLEDADKHELSEYVYTLPENELFDHHNVTNPGVTTTGEFVFSMSCAPKRFYVFYFNPEKNTLQFFDFKDFGEFGKYTRIVHTFVDHVEDLNFNIMNATFISPQKSKTMSTTPTSSEEDHHKLEHHKKQDHNTLESNIKAPIPRIPLEQKRRPTRTLTSSKQAHHQKQERHTLESINKFCALCLLDDNDVGEAECDSSLTEDRSLNTRKRTYIIPPAKKQRKPKRTSKEADRHKKQDRHSTFESINNKSKSHFSFTNFKRPLSLCLITILLFLVIIMFMF